MTVHCHPRFVSATKIQLLTACNLSSLSHQFVDLFQESVMKLSAMLNATMQVFSQGAENATQQRNTCIVLGCLAEKLTGPSNTAILSNTTLNYLIGNLVSKNYYFFDHFLTCFCPKCIIFSRLKMLNQLLFYFL